MRREDDQQLWDLLGQTTAPTASPFFARNVVRLVREGTNTRPSFLRWLRPRVLVPAAVFALAIAFAGITLERGLRSHGDNLPPALTKLEPQDLDVVADLDNLIASEDDGVWDEDDSLPL
ncbi:MAG: hypothetical protein M3032_07220 [Verrucomicrobiota bacterium]|nr:hypothetical protein [Verrucomicrobiota bacterium]